MGYWTHLWSAQRRHGVHSPFVYAYGDQILRKNHYTIFDAVFAQQRQQKTESMIQDLLCFCGVEHIMNDGQSIHLNRDHSHIDLPLVPIPQVSIYSHEFTESIIEDNSMYIVHRHVKMTQNLHRIYKDSNKPLMLMDLYFFQVLIHHDIFKNKQHYQLK